MVQFNFNAQDYQPSTGGMDVLPSGIYDVQMVDSKLQPTKNQRGMMLVCTYSVIAPQEHIGKRIIDRFNIQNDNPQAVEIAFGQLSALSHVVNRIYWSDSAELHGIPFKVRIETGPRSDDPSKMGMDIKGYQDAWGNPPQSRQGSGQASPPPSAPPMASQPPQTPSQPQWQPSQGQAQPPAPQGQQAPWQGQPNGAPQAPQQPPAGYPQPTGQPPVGQPAPSPQPGYGQPPMQPPAPAGSPQMQPPAPAGGPTPPWAAGAAAPQSGQAAPPWAQGQGQ